MTIVTKAVEDVAVGHAHRYCHGEQRRCTVL